jgi:hypothetical protein
LAPTGYADPDGFGAPAVTAHYHLAPTGYVDEDAFGTPIVTPGPVGLFPAGYNDPDTFGAPTVTVKNYLIRGHTRDNAGAPLGGCSFNLFYSDTDILADSMVSGGDGWYSFIVDPTKDYYGVAYKDGTPPVAGTTVRTLRGIRE